MTTPYRDSVEHLADELGRVDGLLREALLAARPGRDADGEELRGLVITETEIDGLLAPRALWGERLRGRADAASPSVPVPDPAIAERVARSRAAGVTLALALLQQRFRLSAAEVDLLLVALAPELDLRYETVFAYLQNDVTRKRPSVDLALGLRARSERDKLDARRLLQAESPLLRHRLLQLADDPNDRSPSFLRRFLKLEDRVVAFLLDEGLPEAESAGTAPPLHALEVAPDARARLEHLASWLAAHPASPSVVELAGPHPALLQEAAGSLAVALGRSLLWIDLTAGPTEIPARVRDAVLWDAALAVRVGPAAADAPDRPAVLQALWNALPLFTGPLLVAGSSSILRDAPPERPLFRVEVAPGGYAERRLAWSAALNGDRERLDVPRLADTFRFGSAEIRRTLSLAAGLARVRGPDDDSLGMRDVLDAGRTLTTPSLERFARRVPARYAWEDLVLPRDRLQQLRRLASRLQARHLVHQEWGFGEKVARCPGLSILFAGPSGTGKTMAAEVLARELSLDLFQIDLSAVVNKYIGETEKHLSSIFEEAERTQALLFFDEADSLFGKRTEQKDAHDRYANIEVNYLLQRIEVFEGVVVLATNLQQNIDEAFLRRMQEVVEFPFPDPGLRDRIWRSHLPAQAPREADIDFAFLARQFDLAGGNIRNVVLGAAFLAAEEQRPIAMADLILSTRGELRKLGKLPVKADFGPYYELIQARD